MFEIRSSSFDIRSCLCFADDTAVSWDTVLNKALHSTHTPCYWAWFSSLPFGARVDDVRFLTLKQSSVVMRWFLS